MISPTVGRVVLFHPGGTPPHRAYAALVAYVHSDRCINVGGFDYNGAPFAATSVPLLQDDDVPSPNGYFAEWMPYQKGQAAKVEALQNDLAINAGLAKGDA